jgi:hypothetical protein
MLNSSKLEKSFKEFTGNIQQWIPDGIVNITLPVLQELGLLNIESFEENNDQLLQKFQVIETEDKVTLLDEQFVIWIVPQLLNESSTTLTYIALIKKDKPRLEIVFSTTGLYNTPRYILNLLQHYLLEMIDMESMILSMKDFKKSSESRCENS